MAGQNRFKDKTKTREFDPTSLLTAGKQQAEPEEPAKVEKQEAPRKKEQEVTQEKPKENVQKEQPEVAEKAEEKVQKKEAKPAAPAKKKQPAAEMSPQIFDLKALEAKNKVKPVKKPTASFTLDPEVHAELKRRAAKAGFPSVTSYLEMILRAVFQMEE